MTKKKQTKRTKQKVADIPLPYFKQGDDLRWFLKENPPKKALLLHAEMLTVAAKQLRRISKLISDSSVEINADTHHIDITGPVKTIDKLIGLKLATEQDWDDDEDCECPEGENEDAA